MNNLAKYRAVHGITQKELGKMVNLGKASISHIEKNTLTEKRAEQFAKILNENKFALLGTDALQVLPKTEEEKRILIKIIEDL